MLAGSVSAQTWTTKQAGNWEDAATWEPCKGGPCGKNGYPDIKIVGTVTINHEVQYTSNPPVSVENRGQLIVNGVTFDNNSNLNIAAGGTVRASGATIKIGPGVLNMNGALFLTNSIMEKDGNVVNNATITMDNACFSLISGNFNNYGTLSGVGGVRVLGGNINNPGSWPSEILYYFANNSSGLPGAPSTQEEIDEVCLCALTNCDIQWATDYVLVHDGKLSNALFILGRDGYDPAKEYFKFIYKIRVDGGVPKVLVQIVVGDAESDYSNLLSQLAFIGVLPSDFITDYDTVGAEEYITCYVPIANLLALDNSPYLIQVLDGRLALNNTAAVLSEGVAAMRANIAKLGWGVTGEGITIGVISDSFNSQGGYGSDQAGEDLPGPQNPNPGQQTAVEIVPAGGDLPPGEGTDEGRAMLQLVHDVAPGATLKFATGFNGKYNFASQYAALRAAGCDIIIDDVQYVDEAMYRDDVVAQAVNNIVDDGALVFTAAGNFGSKSIEQVFTPAPSNPNFHNWGGGSTEQSLTLDPGFYIIAVHWKDKHASLGDVGGAQVDLNVYLGESPDILDFGSNIVNIGKDPMEFMYFLVLNPTTTNILVERTAGTANVPFKYVVFRSGDTFDFIATPSLNASTIVGHANAEKNFTVGAVRYDNLYDAQQSSSRGGTATSADGIAPAVARSKPDAMGPTGGDTTVPIGPDYDNDGKPNFFGTSAAAPHVGAVAAMLMEAGNKFGVDLSGTSDPALTVRNLLLSTAVGAGAPLVTGAGFVRADLALGAIANPTPELLDLNWEYLLETNPGFVPGAESFTLKVEGNYFTTESVVYFQGEALPTTFVNSQQLTVTIPPFIGNGDTYVFTPSKEGATGDGGDSETRNFYQLDAKNVIIKANDITRYYGVSVTPATHPELFGFTVSVVDAATGELVSLPDEELALFNDATKFPVSYTTTDAVGSPSNVTYSVILNVDLNAVDPGLLELYNFDKDGSDENGEIKAGNLVVEPIPVQISLDVPDTVIYGDPLPGITYVFNYEDPLGNAINIDPTIKSEYETAHKNAFRLVNSFLLVNGSGSFRLVNDDTQVNRFRLVNCEDPDPEVNRFRLVNGECEPEINGFRLVNQTFYVSQAAIDDSQSQVATNRFRLVNGDDFNDETKIVNLDAELFSTVNQFRLVNRSFNLVNAFRLVNRNTFNLVNQDGTTNRTFNLVNGLEYSEGSAYYNGELVNRFRLVNGSSFRLVNGSFNLVNSDTGQPDPFVGDTENSVVLFNSDEASEDENAAPISVFPINGITGKDVGIQYVFTGRVFNNNFEAVSLPTPIEILPRPIEVTTKNFPAEGEAPVVYGDYGDAVLPTGVQPDFQFEVSDLQYGETPEEVLAGISLSACADCTDGKYPVGSYDILANFDNLTSQAARNYTITQNAATIGKFTVSPFEVKVSLGDVALAYGDPVPDGGFPFTVTKPDGSALSGLPYGESVANLFTLVFTPSDGCAITDPALSVITAEATSVNPNYKVTEVADGDLTVTKATLDVQVGTRSIIVGDPIPATFTVTASGWVCGDSETPTASGFQVFALDGSGPLTGTLAAGEYNVRAVFDNPFGFDLYDINQISDGKLYVNPLVGCNDRLQAADVCKTDNVTLPDYTWVTTLVKFTVINSLDVPIYVPVGPNNKFKGNAKFVIPGGHPSLFMPGATVIDVYTNGGGLQMEIITPGCNSASKSANGSNANPCTVNLEASMDLDAQVLGIEEVQSMAYPNPAIDYLNLFVGDQQGQIDVQVFDTTGRMLISRDYGVTGLQEIQLDISALNPGFYFVKVGKADPIQIIKQ